MLKFALIASYIPNPKIIYLLSHPNIYLYKNKLTARAQLRAPAVTYPIADYFLGAACLLLAAGFVVC